MALRSVCCMHRKGYVRVYQMQLLMLKVLRFHHHCTAKGQTFMAEWFLDYACLFNWLFHNTRSVSQYCDYDRWWVIRGSNPGKDKHFFSSQKRADRLWGSSKLLSSGTMVHYRSGGEGSKSARREVGHSPSFRFGVKNEWSYKSTPPICLHEVDRDNLTFLFCMITRGLKMVAGSWSGWCVSVLVTIVRM